MSDQPDSGYTFAPVSAVPVKPAPAPDRLFLHSQLGSVRRLTGETFSVSQTQEIAERAWRRDQQGVERLAEQQNERALVVRLHECGGVIACDVAPAKHKLLTYDPRVAQHS